MNDTTFLQAFEATTLSPEEWDHRAHLRMGYLYVRDHPFETAVDHIRKGIKRLNQAHKKPETQFSGYHETLTISWIWIIAAAVASHDTMNDFDSFEGFIAANPYLLDTSQVWQYYSPQHALTPAARQAFVEPDIKALPKLEYWQEAVTG